MAHTLGCREALGPLRDLKHKQGHELRDDWGPDDYWEPRGVGVTTVPEITRETEDWGSSLDDYDAEYWEKLN